MRSLAALWIFIVYSVSAISAETQQIETNAIILVPHGEDPERSENRVIISQGIVHEF